MEFQCRVASANGQIIETTYVAESEARLRLELEEKGLFLLSVRGRGGVGVGGYKLRLPRRRALPAREFIVFNQELATLLKAGLPLVQSLEILRRRVPNPVFKAALDDIYEKVRSGTALSEAFEAQHLFSGVYTASLMAGEKSGSLEQVIRRYVAHMKVLASVRGHVISALIYPAVLVVLSIFVVGLIVFKVVPEFAEFYGQYGENAQLPMSTRIVVAISTNLVGSATLIIGSLLRRRRGGDSLVSAARAAPATPREHPPPAVLRAAGAQVGHGAGVAHAGDAALGRHSARQCARHRGHVGGQPVHRRGSGGRGQAGPRGREPGGRARRAETCSRTWPSRWWKSASPPARWPTC